MPVQSTDAFLVQRSGVSYKVTAANAGTVVLDSDVLLVNRSGVSYKITGANFKAAAFGDADLYLVNRSGVSYKATGAEVKAILNTSKLVITSVAFSENVPGGNRYTSQKFTAVATLQADGPPVSTKSIKAWTNGLVSTPVTTSAITQVTQTGSIPVWTPFDPTPKGQSHTYQDVNWVGGLGLFFAIGDINATPTASISANGTNWTTTNFSATLASRGNFRAGAWSPELGVYAAVGTSLYASTADGGVNWQSGVISGNFNGIAWSAPLGLFVAVGSGTYKSSTSPDGVTWTRRTTLTKNAWSICWAPALSMFVAATDQGIVTSVDGINWTDCAGTSTYAVRGVAWSPALGLLVATCNTAFVLTSTDSITWTATASALTENPVPNSVKWLPDLSLFVACRVQVLLYSSDGLNWRAGSTNVQIGTGLAKVDWSPTLSLCVAVGSAASAPNLASRTSDFRAGFTELTLANSSQFGGLTLREEMREVNASGAAEDASGFLRTIDAASNKLTVEPPSTLWTVGNYIQTVKPKAPASTVKAFCNLDATGTVTGLSTVDPGFTAWTHTGTNPYTGTLTFPATLYGQAPDLLMPAGTSITVEVQAVEGANTANKVSNTVIP